MIEENLSAKSLSFAALPGGRMQSGNPTWFTSGIDRAGYNGVTWAKWESSRVDEQIEATLEPFRQAQIPLTWWVGPLSQPGNLGRTLQSHGFIHNRDMVGMASPLNELAPLKCLAVECAFEPVTDRRGLEAWLPLFMDVFGVPQGDAPSVLDAFDHLSFSPDSQWRHYMFRAKDGQVVATSSLHLGADVAGLYNIATRREYREKGLGAAITWLTYEQAMGWGYEIGTLQTTYPNALRLYHRMGFEVYCKFGVYQRNW